MNFASLPGCTIKRVPNGRNLRLEVFREGARLATAEFSEHGDFAYCNSLNIESPRYLANLAVDLYNLAEESLGKPPVNFWSRLAVE